MMHGGDLVASVLHRHNVKWIFTLCGGHISPILTACKEIGIQVISVRHEVTGLYLLQMPFRGCPATSALLWSQQDQDSPTLLQQ